MAKVVVLYYGLSHHGIGSEGGEGQTQLSPPPPPPCVLGVQPFFLPPSLPPRCTSFCDLGEDTLRGHKDASSCPSTCTYGASVHTHTHTQTAPVISCDWLPNAQQLVTASWDRSARLWDFEKGQMIHFLEGKLRPHPPV